MPTKPDQRAHSCITKSGPEAESGSKMAMFSGRTIYVIALLTYVFDRQNVILSYLQYCNTALFPVVHQDAERPVPLQCRARLGGFLKYDACDTACVFRRYVFPAQRLWL